MTSARIITSSIQTLYRWRSVRRRESARLIDCVFWRRFMSYLLYVTLAFIFLHYVCLYSCISAYHNAHFECSNPKLFFWLWFFQENFVTDGENLQLRLGVYSNSGRAVATHLLDALAALHTHLRPKKRAGRIPTSASASAIQLTASASVNGGGVGGSEGVDVTVLSRSVALQLVRAHLTANEETYGRVYVFGFFCLFCYIIFIFPIVYLFLIFFGPHFLFFSFSCNTLSQFVFFSKHLHSLVWKY